MKRYKYSGIILEITRRCNLKCEHCIRGEQQNLDLTDVVINRLFDNLEECKLLNLTGGEPLLAIDIIEYLVDEIIRRNIKIETINLVTNGTIKDRRIVDILARFCDSAEERKAMLRISTDSFHKQDESKKAYDFYMEAAKQYERLEILETRPFGEVGSSIFIIAGRAKNLLIEHPELVPVIGRRKESIYDHRVTVGNNTVFCMLHITVNGDICVFEDRSFETNDRMTIGNIMVESMYDLINRHNDNCMISCRDVQLFELNNHACVGDSDIWNDSLLPLHMAFTAKIIAMIAVILFPRVWEARKIAHKKWPLIPAQDIIEMIPVPELTICVNSALRDLIATSEQMSIEEMVNYLDVELLEEADRVIAAIRNDKTRRFNFQNDYEQVVDSLRALALFHKPNATISPNRVYGTGNLFETAEFKDLEQLNAKYEAEEGKHDNTKMLQCEMVQTTKDYLNEVISREITEQAKNMDPLSGALTSIMMAEMLFGGKK